MGTLVKSGSNSKKLPARTVRESDNSKLLSLPPAPNAAEIKKRRIAAGLSSHQAAALCGAGDRTWRRWESGESEMSRSKWGWFLAAIGELTFDVENSWQGWSFRNGEFVDPETNRGYQPGQIRAIQHYMARISALEREKSTLERRLSEFRCDPVAGNRQRLAGQLFAAGNMLMSAAQSARDSSADTFDPLVEELGGRDRYCEGSELRVAAEGVYDQAIRLMKSVKPAIE